MSVPRQHRKSVLPDKPSLISLPFFKEALIDTTCRGKHLANFPAKNCDFNRNLNFILKILTIQWLRNAHTFIFFHDFESQLDVHWSIMSSRQSCFLLVFTPSWAESTLWVEISLFHSVYSTTQSAATSLEAQDANEQYPPAKMHLILRPFSPSKITELQERINTRHSFSSVQCSYKELIYPEAVQQEEAQMVESHLHVLAALVCNFQRSRLSGSLPALMCDVWVRRQQKYLDAMFFFRDFTASGLHKMKLFSFQSEYWIFTMCS